MTTTYKQLGTEIGELCDRKSAAYGDSIGKSVEVLKLLYPSGLRPDQYLDAILAARRLDKLCRIAQGAKDEEDPRVDLVGYDLLDLAMHREGQLLKMVSPPHLFAMLTVYENRNRIEQCALCKFPFAHVEQPLCTTFLGAPLLVCSLRCQAYFVNWKEPAPCPNVDANAAEIPSTMADASASHPATAPAQTAETASPSSASDCTTPSKQPSLAASPATDASASTAQAPASSPGVESAAPRSIDQLIEIGSLRNMRDLCATCSDRLTQEIFTAGCHYRNRNAFVILNFCNHTCSSFFFVSMRQLL